MIEKTEKGVSYMTSDAKVGLLLGLVFIVVIAFLLNGLPGLIAKGSSDKLIEQSVPTYSGDFGLDKKADEVVDILKSLDDLKFKKRDSEKDDPRYNEDQVAGGRKKTSDKKIRSGKKFYTVKSGDSLGKIAKKIYGNDIGNKQATVDGIFQANSHILSSPDDIKIGQKLKMPSLDGKKELDLEDVTIVVRKSSKEDGKSSQASGAFGKFRNAYNNLFSKDRSKSSPLYAIYVVKEGDNLWNIASKKLGSGVRRTEIKKINKSILKGSDDLAPGMKLKIPQK